MTKVGRPKHSNTPRDVAVLLKQSALDLFSRKNFSAVTIKEIGNEAGVTTAVIYYHYRDKNDLFNASIEHALETALKRFEQVSEGTDDPVRLIHEWLQLHVELHSEIAKVLTLVIDYNHSSSQSTRVDAAIAHFYDTEKRLIIDCINKGQTLGVFKAGEPEHVSTLISTFLDGAVVRTQIAEEYDIERAIQEFEQTLWAILGYAAT
jgi:AcrR family transcriptional regulator